MMEDLEREEELKNLPGKRWAMPLLQPELFLCLVS
jgi:hypothetical protein